MICSLIKNNKNTMGKTNNIQSYLNKTELNLQNTSIEYLITIFNPDEFQFVLKLEPFNQSTLYYLYDILTECETKEYYEYCCIIRDEVNDRLFYN